MKLLLLGATGFVGSNILGQLADLGCQIDAVYRKADSPRGNIKSSVRWLAYAELFDGGLEIAPDALLSLAGGGEPAAFENDPVGSLAADEIADFVAALAERFRIRKVVSLSSGGAIYGEGWDNGKRRVFDESDICQPISTYGKCKFASEARLAERLDSAGLLSGLVILRASNVYGSLYAKGGRQGLINALIERAIDRRPITIYGDGMIYRDYLFASDLAHAVKRALQTKVQGIFNVASGLSHSILEVIESVEVAVGESFEKRFEPQRDIDLKYSALSVRKAQDLLGWHSQISLRAGIDLILQTRSAQSAQQPCCAIEIREGAASAS